MSHFFAYLARMKLIRRWGLMRNTSAENIQEHSLQTAMIAHGLAVIRNRRYGGTVNPERVMALAVYHEVSEVITGDLATPIKYFNPAIREAYGAIEDVAREKLLHMLPEELKGEFIPLLFAQPEDAAHWEIVKAADKICAYLKCCEELRSGNQEFAPAARTIQSELARLSLPEVAYFMDCFAGSFHLSLDELG